MVSPHRVVSQSEATAGQNSANKAPQRLASTTTITEARRKMLASSSRQYQGAGQCGDKIGDSGENWFPEVSIETPEFKQIFGRQNPHRRTAAHLSARALKHIMFRAFLIAFHGLFARDLAIRCCHFWVSHPKSGLSRRATHSCSLRALFASHHPPLRPPLRTHAPIVISAYDALQMRQYASLRSAMSVR